MVANHFLIVELTSRFKCGAVNRKSNSCKGRLSWRVQVPDSLIFFEALDSPLRDARGHLGWNGRLPMAQPFACGVWGKDVREEVTLQVVDAKADESFGLHCRLNPFGDNLEAEGL